MLEFALLLVLWFAVGGLCIKELNEMGDAYLEWRDLSSVSKLLSFIIAPFLYLVLLAAKK